MDRRIQATLKVMHDEIDKNIPVRELAHAGRPQPDSSSKVKTQVFIPERRFSCGRLAARASDH